MKVLLSVGGWKMGSDEFTKTVSSTGNMYVFAQNAVEYLHRYNFNGLDVDWEYPADRGSPAGDKQHFTAFLELLRREFQHDHAVTRRPTLELSVAIAPAPFRVRASYQIPQIAQYVDFINVMTYDLHGQWDHAVGHHTPLYSPTEDETDSIVCQLLTEHNDTVSSTGRLPNSQSPYIVDGTRWTGYDDARSMKEKVDYAAQMGLGGVAIWSIDLDDFHGICGEGHYPLMHAIRQQMHTSIIG